MKEAVSLTTFVDFVCRAGTPKATVVRQWKRRQDYNVARDYYKVLRDAIVDHHRKGTAMPMPSTTPKNKRENYRIITRGHRKWVGRKALRWFNPATDVWTSGQLNVNINPELGLRINGVPHLVKLYFKADKLSKNRVDIVTHLMSAVLSSAAPPHCVMGVLDLRNGKLFTAAGPIPGLDAQLGAEAAYWNALWSHI